VFEIAHLYHVDYDLQWTVFRKVSLGAFLPSITTWKPDAVVLASTVVKFY